MVPILPLQCSRKNKGMHKRKEGIKVRTPALSKMSSFHPSHAMLIHRFVALRFASLRYPFLRYPELGDGSYRRTTSSSFYSKISNFLCLPSEFESNPIFPIPSFQSFITLIYLTPFSILNTHSQPHSHSEITPSSDSHSPL